MELQLLMHYESTYPQTILDKPFLCSEGWVTTTSLYRSPSASSSPLRHVPMRRCSFKSVPHMWKYRTRMAG